MFQFLLDAKSIAGTIVEKRIKDFANQGIQGKTVYKLKRKTTITEKIVKNMDMYTDEQIESIQDTLAEFNLFYGYTST